ncbi:MULTISPECIES: hypothetical protein [Cyanophyceae]|nr:MULTISPECIES: hypothetical protein [Cyanophyceae]MDB9357379.1 hypothetical protein [Nodularia spumigena CS-587/03]MDB9306668.1 hypothetical protein [Nodularia spumigena CS-591/12]MDB9317565.1 hypothetical protein [Nodularia spumigena CS-590/01A]MDB9322284.1 hypothetical protein [Nodularia spumigena CS-591/07A]MDB9326045.1 hypothetical protein [Nodularia spumigena CS-590/02]
MILAQSREVASPLLLLRSPSIPIELLDHSDIQGNSVHTACGTIKGRIN